MRLRPASSIRRALAEARARGRASIDRTAHLQRGARIEVAPGARLKIGPRCVIGEHVRIFVRAGELTIEEGVVLEERCTVLALGGVAIGRGTRIQQRAAIFDLHPAAADDTETPLRKQQPRSAGIEIGADALIGRCAVVETGVQIEPQMHVRAGSTVSAAS